MNLQDIFETELKHPPWYYLHKIWDAGTYFIKKEQVVQEAIDDENWVFIEGFKRATDPRNNNIINDAEYKESSYGHGFTWTQFMQLDDKISNRELFSYEKHDAIKMAMEDSDKDVWNQWFRLILNRNLHSNMSYKILNRVLERNNLKHLGVELFYPQRMKEFYDKYSCVSGDKIIDYKIDGTRLAVLADPHGEAIAYDRSGKISTLHGFLLSQYTNFASKFLKEPVVFDGEVVSEEFFYMRDKGYASKDMRLMDSEHYVFDIIPWEEYKNRVFFQPLEDRRNFLIRMLENAHYHGYLTNVKLIGSIRLELDTQTGKNMDKLFDRFKEGLEWGYEGLVIKNPTKPYKCYRTHDWLKLKLRHSMELLICEILEDDKNPGRAFTFICKVAYKDSYIITRVGKNFTPKQKLDFWENRHKLINMHVEVSYSRIVPPRRYKNYYSLEYSSFVKLRPDLDDSDET